MNPTRIWVTAGVESFAAVQTAGPESRAAVETTGRKSCASSVLAGIANLVVTVRAMMRALVATFARSALERFDIIPDPRQAVDHFPKITLPRRIPTATAGPCYSCRMEWVISAWGRILTGYTPALSIEITRECPLRCPGCYAYGDDHLGAEVTLREVRDFKGQELIDGVLALVDRHRPLHLSIVGGEPLVRYRELNTLLPLLSKRRIHVQLVTSAVREIPLEWRGIPRLSIVVSVDGLQPEHDVRRTPATYDRILKHIAGHSITVHCTVTRQQVNRAGYLEEFVRFWSERSEVSRIWM